MVDHANHDTELSVPKDLSPQETLPPSEISSIDLGSKDEINFDEIITFTHTYLKYRLFDGLIEKVEEFPLLMNHEFLLAGNITIDEKSLSSMNNKEILSVVKSRATSYNNDGDVNFKCLFLENLPNYANEIGFESTVDLLLPIVIKVPQEKESVRIKFLQIFKRFISYLSDHGEEGYKLIRDQMVPILNEIFQDKKNARIIELCSEALVDVTRYIKDEEKGYHILTIVIILAHDDTDEESRVLAARLFNQLAPIIGRELCELYVVPQIASFADDPQSKVRKAVACNFMNMCTSVSELSFKAKLIPVYQKLSKDSLWIVRKAAAENLPKITTLCDGVTVSSTLLEIFKSFTMDNQKYVRIAAIEVLGQFIALLKKEDLSQSILDFYLNIIDEYYSTKDNNTTNEADIIFHCAFNFPAVLFSFGPHSWTSLKRVYFKMAQDKDFKVKKSIASSLAEIANLIGGDIAEAELISVLEKLYREEGEIQNTILKILPDFLRKINPNLRRNYLERPKRLLNPREKWRGRKEYAAIIGSFHNVFDAEMTYKQIFPIALNFCFDDVAEVRVRAAKRISPMVLQLLAVESSNDQDMEYQAKCLTIIESFALSINYHYRQLFALMCSEIFENECVSKKFIIGHLNSLAYDRVINVRITLAKVISKLYKHKKYSWALSSPEINAIACILKSDANKNVSVYFNGIEVNEVAFDRNIDVNSKFVNTMGFVKEEFGIARNIPISSKAKETIPPANVDLSMKKVEDKSLDNPLEVSEKTSNGDASISASTLTVSPVVDI